jgi:hypothetical protein
MLSLLSLLALLVALDRLTFSWAKAMKYRSRAKAEADARLLGGR